MIEDVHVDRTELWPMVPNACIEAVNNVVRGLVTQYTSIRTFPTPVESNLVGHIERSVCGLTIADHFQYGRLDTVVLTDHQ